jgi:hypothetical protein
LDGSFDRSFDGSFDCGFDGRRCLQFQSGAGDDQVGVVDLVDGHQLLDGQAVAVSDGGEAFATAHHVLLRVA